MELKRKKFIAREIIVFISCWGLAIIAFLGTYPYNYIINREIVSQKEYLESYKLEIDSLKQVSNIKLQKQVWLFNSLSRKFNLISSGYPSYQELWSRLEEMQLNNTIEYFWNNRFESDFKEALYELDIKSLEEFNQFIFDYSLTDPEKENLEKAEKMSSQQYKLEDKINVKKYDVLNINQQLGFSMLSFLIILILAFPVRYIIYLMIWSIKVIRQKE